MPHPMHESVVTIVEKAIELIDRFMRNQIDQEEYVNILGSLEADEILSKYQDDFKSDPGLVYYLDALMLLDSLKNQLDFQVAEYGANVAQEDMKYLKELMRKFPADN